MCQNIAVARRAGTFLYSFGIRALRRPANSEALDFAPLGRRLAGVVELLDHRTAVGRGPRRRRPRWMPPGFCSVADVAMLAPISRATAFRDARRGRLHTERWRGRLVVGRAALDDYLAGVPTPADRDHQEGGND